MYAQLLVTFVDLFSMVFYILLIGRIILSYIVSPTNSLYTWLVDITEPLLAPLRKVLPTIPGLDIAPLGAFILLQVIQLAVHRFVG